MASGLNGPETRSVWPEWAEESTVQVNSRSELAQARRGRGANPRPHHVGCKLCLGTGACGLMPNPGLGMGTTWAWPKLGPSPDLQMLI